MARLARCSKKTTEQVTEFSHLAEATGLSVSKIAELTATLQDFGAGSVDLARIMTRLARASEDAAHGNGAAVRAFRELGVSTQGWAKNLPAADELLLKISDHMHSSTAGTLDLAAASHVMGRNVVGMVGVLKQGREELQKHIEANKGYGDSMQNAARSAASVVQLQSQLSHQWSQMAAELLPMAIFGVQSLVSSWHALIAVLTSTSDITMTASDSIAQGIVGSIKVVNKAIRGDLVGAVKEMKISGDTMADGFQNQASRIAGYFAEAREKIAAIWKTPPAEAAGATAADLPSDSASDDKGAKRRARSLALALKEMTEASRDHQIAMAELQRAAIMAEDKREGDHASARLQFLQQVETKELGIKLDAIAKERAALNKSDDDYASQFAKLAGEEQKARDEFAKKTSQNAAAAAEDQRKTSDKLLAGALDLGDRLNGLAKRMAEQRAGIEAKVQELQLAGAEKHQDMVLALERRRIEFEATMGQISESQKLTLLQASYDREYGLQIASYKKEIAALDAHDKEYLVKVQELQNKIAAVQSQQAQQHQGTGMEQAKLGKVFNPFGDVAGAAFQRGITSWIDGTRRFSAAFRQMGQEMVLNWTQSLVQMSAQWIAHLAQKLANYVLTSVGLLVVDQMTASTSQAISAESHMKKIYMSAKESAANTYASVSTLPPPLGEILAPIAAAAAFTTVLALGAISAERGAVLPNMNTMAFLHPNEMVLPAHLSTGLQGLIAGGGGGGGTTHIHVGGMTNQFSGGAPMDPGTFAKSVVGALNAHLRNTHRPGI